MVEQSGNEPTGAMAARLRRLTIRCRRQMGVLLLFWLCAAALFWYAGMFAAEFGGHPDEAGHYVTGLMVRDYLAAGLGTHPMRYAETYYRHYPKVALGHWPPMFYLIQACWSLPFSPGRISVRLLMALLTAGLGTMVYGQLRPSCGHAVGIFGGLALIGLPLVQTYGGMIMTEIPVAIFCLAAALCFARYMVDEKPGQVLAFGVFAAAAILTKGTGLLLALLPPFALVLGGRPALFRRQSLWGAAAIVVVLCGPWTWLTLGMVKDGWLASGPSWAFTSAALPYYGYKLFVSAGTLLTLLAVIGVWLTLSAEAVRAIRATGATLLALILAVLVFHVVIPCGFEPRHLLPALPPLVLLACLGLHHWIDLIAQRRGRRGAAAAVLTVAAVCYAATVFEPVRLRYAGFAPAAARFVAAPVAGAALVSSDARGEGMFIAEVAMRDVRPGHVVRRASKLFADSGWSGAGYQAKVASVADVIRLLRAAQVTVVLVDASIPAAKRTAHHALVEQSVGSRPDVFVEQARYDITRDNRIHAGALAVYRLRLPTAGSGDI